MGGCRYDQAGTPEVKVAKESFDERARQYKLTLAQSPASTPGQPAESKRPFLIPVTVGLLSRYPLYLLSGKRGQRPDKPV